LPEIKKPRIGKYHLTARGVSARFSNTPELGQQVWPLLSDNSFEPIRKTTLDGNSWVSAVLVQKREASIFLTFPQEKGCVPFFYLGHYDNRLMLERIFDVIH
jgi:hypothetical protein